MSLSKFVCESSDEEHEDELIILAALVERRRLLYCRNINGVQGPVGQKKNLASTGILFSQMNRLATFERCFG